MTLAASHRACRLLLLNRKLFGTEAAPSPVLLLIYAKDRGGESDNAGAQEVFQVYETFGP